ncbi:MAG: toll/interleukin-1 receptor domain-containing protein [Henriciella sp.]|nr:toll/interleukin-1 receptor domain-containing protein [Henriciella sp.]
MANGSATIRETIFISKATPGDDPFALWLAPRLESEGYKVFADILSLDTGDVWRRKITDTLQTEAVKMLLCCSDDTLARRGVIEEIGIAEDLAKELKDPNFILPLKMKRFKKVFGIGELQYINFENRWAEGLAELLKSLERQDVPKASKGEINPNWAAYQRRQAVSLEDEPEVLTSNWLRILSAPDKLYLLEPTGPFDVETLKARAADFVLPVIVHERGLLTFASPFDLEEHFLSVGRFEAKAETALSNFMEHGSETMGIEARDAKNMVVNLFRQAWEKHMSAKGFYTHAYATGAAHHVDASQIDLNKRISWGRQGERRSSVLRNKARGKIWSYGVSAQPSLFPWPHYRMKARVLFSEEDKNTLKVIGEKKDQHRLRRSICSSWRNKAWHGRLMAFLELLAGDSPYVDLPVGGGGSITVDAMPVQVTSPKTARQVFVQNEEAEEEDLTTLSGPPVVHDTEPDAEEDDQLAFEKESDDDRVS